MAEYQNIFTRVQVRPDHPHMGVPLERGVQQIELTNLAVELHGGWVGGITGAGLVIAIDQGGVPLDGVEHGDCPRKGVGASLGKCGNGALICIK